jgi:predicted  nucleic acid-binding Zn-ribbon protein
MPTSIDPELADDEIECARCGARFSYELTRCPNCGVNLYEPEDDYNPADARESPSPGVHQNKAGSRLEGFIRRLTRKPYPVDELFGTAINQAELYDNLQVKVGGDRAAVERLIAFERQLAPQGNRIRWLKSAIQRWEQDNRASGSTQ